MNLSELSGKKIGKRNYFKGLLTTLLEAFFTQFLIATTGVMNWQNWKYVSVARIKQKSFTLLLAVLGGIVCAFTFTFRLPHLEFSGNY